MTAKVLDNLSKLQSSLRAAKTIPNISRCLTILDNLFDYIEDPLTELNIYTSADLDVAIYKARASDSERLKESSIIIEELKKVSAAHKHRADHFERVCSEHLTCITRYQTEISSLSLTVIKHQRNSEASQSELTKMKREFEELTKVNSTLAASISHKDRASTLENAALKARVDSLQKSADDYSDAFKSTKRKLLLAKRQHKDLLGMADPESPMGQELDTASLEWGSQGLAPDTDVGSLLSSDGTSQAIIFRRLSFEMSGESDYGMIGLDLSDANCLM